MNLPIEIKKRLTGHQWYHQRFDGSPMFLFPITEAEPKKEKRKPAGTEANIRVCFFSEGKADWYLDMEDVNRGAKIMVNLAKKDPKISTKLMAAWKKDEDKFENLFWKKFPKINLKKLSDKELIDLWKTCYQLFISRVTSSSIIDHFALGTDELIGKMLRKEIGTISRESEFTNIFSIATAPVRHSFINQAEIDLLKIATGISKESLEDYQKRYFWTKNNYIVAQELSVAYFKKEINAWKKSKKNLKEELKNIEETPKKNKLEKQKLFKKHKFSPLLMNLLKISEDFTWWQDERKKSTYLNIHMGVKILKELGKRINYNLEELKYAVPPEIPGLLNQKPTKKELKARKKNSVLIATREKYYLKTGKDAEEIKKLMLGTQKLSELQDIRGLSASMGRAIGTVKIIKSATEISKIKKGDILVAVMTRPDYVPAIKKAAAIVTDEGGITCHAAIISRELRIPCIIGTKIATKALKDGDYVEVNANHGLVKIIRK